MKKKLVLLLGLSVILSGCKIAPSTSVSYSDSNELSNISSIESSVEKEIETSVYEETEETHNYITDISLIPEEKLASLTIDDSGIEIVYDYEGGNCFIKDEEKTVYFYWKYADPYAITKRDFDNDGIDEYEIMVNFGHGTGYYQNSLLIVKEGFNEPIAKIHCPDISLDLINTYHFTYDETLRALFLKNQEDEGVAYLYMGTYLDDHNADFVNAYIGDITFVNNQTALYIDEEWIYWIEATVGIVTSEFSWPAYEYTLNLTFPVYVSKDYEITYGDISYKTYDYEKKYVTESSEITNILWETTIDYDHDGFTDRLVTFVPSPGTIQDFTSGYTYGELQILPGYADGSYSDLPIITRTFDRAHVGNGQMFKTTINGKDFLIETSFWAGQGVKTYAYKVFFEAYDNIYVLDSYRAEFDYDAQPAAPDEFWEGINKWLNDSSVLIYAADIDTNPNLLYSTEKNILSPNEYLNQK